MYISHPQKRAFFFVKTLSLLLLLPLFFFFGGCKKTMDYSPYVSELRSNILLAEEEDFSLRIYVVNQEIPYTADGIPHKMGLRTEFFLTAPDGSHPCQLTFTHEGQQLGGDMSYDSVKGEYYFSCTLNLSDIKTLSCEVLYGKQTVNFTAYSIKNSDTLSPTAALKALQETEAELFASLTDKYGFAGEIYIRILYENAAFYYIGVIDRTGKVSAFLLNAQTGKVLAKRTL